MICAGRPGGSSEHGRECDLAIQAPRLIEPRREGRIALATDEMAAETSAFVREERLARVCHDELSEAGTGTEVAYELISNELLLAGSARLNLATFVTTYMPALAARLMADTADKNMID